MTYLVLGLVVFLGAHSVRIVAPGWRAACIARWGPGTWKSIIGVLSIASFLLIIRAYGQVSASAPAPLWALPATWQHALALLTLPAFILLPAAYVPRNHFKAWLGHPMILAVMLWALAHLLINGRPHAMLLFGSFLLWAIQSFRAARRREPALGAAAGAKAVGTALTLAIGIAAWLGFAFTLHARWVGVAPFG